MRARARWCAAAFVVSGCLPKNTPDAPVFSVTEPTGLAWDVGPHPMRELTVRVEHGDDVRIGEWSWELIPSEASAEVQLTPHDGDVVRFVGFPDGESRAPATDFTQHVLRSTLWITLPNRPVTLGESWDDPQWVEPFLGLMPAGTADRVHGRSELVSLVRRETQTEAVIDSIASVSFQGRTVIEAQARGVFRVTTGELLSREVTARFYTPTGPDTLRIAVSQPGG